MRMFDHAAATPMRQSVRAAYAQAPELANPASTHRAGQRARAVLEDARERIAAALGAHPTEVVLTSGGTESINLALKGAWWASGPVGERGALVIPVAEHHATLDAVEWLAREGAKVRWVGVDSHAVTDVSSFAEALSGAAVASVLVASNEVGSLQPIPALSAAASGAGVPLHIDAVGAIGHAPVHFAESGASFMSVSSHKVGGPAGLGALLVRRDAKLEALHHGGGQQRALRSGTQDALSASLFALALEEAVGELAAVAVRHRVLTERILAAASQIDGVRVLASDERLPNIAHFIVEGSNGRRTEGEALQFMLDEAGLAVSHGSACTAGVARESHVVRACGYEGVAPLRISLGSDTTGDDVDALLAVLPGAIRRTRALGAGVGTL